jgi:metal-responsive CopG/Arc/MetJ family transcriptional regulator
MDFELKIKPGETVALDPRWSTPTSVRLGKLLLQRYDREAARRGTSRSALLQSALLAWIDANETPEPGQGELFG